ncbi:tagatose-bisphosphate aldolase, partial [Salmonella enterica subsp. enterica serovar Newport]|nr:tagatose-bisphosphate aldolase [Salmonella enterica subsp. enterica serovar Newport]
MKLQTLHTISLPYISFRNFHLSDQNHKTTLRKPINSFEEEKRKNSEIKVKEIIARHKAGEHLGICSVCSAH